MRPVHKIGDDSAPLLHIHPSPGARQWMRRGHPLRHHKIGLLDTNVWIDICSYSVIKEGVLDLFNSDQQQIIAIPPLQLAELAQVASHDDKEDVRTAASRALAVIGKMKTTRFLYRIERIILAEHGFERGDSTAFLPLISGDEEAGIRESLKTWSPGKPLAGYDLEQQKIDAGIRVRTLIEEAEKVQEKHRIMLAPMRPFDFFGVDGRDRAIAAIPDIDEALRSRLLESPTPTLIIAARVEAVVEGVLTNMFIEPSRRKMRRKLGTDKIVDLSYCKYANYFDFFLTKERSLHDLILRSDLPVLSILDGEPSLKGRIWIYLVDELNINVELKREYT